MGTLLTDNTVIPSYLAVRESGEPSHGDYQTDFGLKVGEVKEIVYPNDPRSLSKRFVEYTVEISSSDSGGPPTSTKYFGCVLANNLGGVADICRYTLRGDQLTTKNPDGVSAGSKVLVLCIDGFSTKAVIIGGLRDTGLDRDGSGRQGVDQKADGHNLFWEFNGAQITVNDAGELQILFRGATDVRGGLKGTAEAEGSFVKFDRLGGITIATPKSNQTVQLDHQNKKIQIQSGDWAVTVDGRATIETQKDFAVTTHAQASVEAAELIKLDSAGVHTGAATDATVLGTTYRAAESAKNVALAGAFSAMATMMAQVAASLASLTPNPTVGPAMAAAATGLAATQPMFAAAAAALNSFEAAAPTYLSKKNLSD